MGDEETGGGRASQQDSVKVRRFEPRDQGAARDVVLEGLGEHFGFVDESRNPDLDDIGTHYEARGHAFFVAESGGGVVGTAGLLFEHPRYARIVRMSVAARIRRAGVGSMLLAALAAEARARSIDELVARTQPEWPAAMSFYTRHGFSPFDADDVDVHLRRRMLDEVGRPVPHTRYVLEVTPESFVPRAGDESALAVEQLDAAEPARGRHLWSEVGRTFWSERSRWTDDRWARHLAEPRTLFFVARVEGRDAGFFELRRSARGVKIEGIGLTLPWRGRRLGGALLTVATRRALSGGVKRVWLDTATDDHPNALPNYLARGYRVVGESILRNPMTSPG